MKEISVKEILQKLYGEDLTNEYPDENTVAHKIIELNIELEVPNNYATELIPPWEKKNYSEEDLRKDIVKVKLPIRDYIDDLDIYRNAFCCHFDVGKLPASDILSDEDISLWINQSIGSFLSTLTKICVLDLGDGNEIFLNLPEMELIKLSQLNKEWTDSEYSLDTKNEFEHMRDDIDDLIENNSDIFEEEDDEDW